MTKMLFRLVTVVAVLALAGSLCAQELIDIRKPPKEPPPPQPNLAEPSFKSMPMHFAPDSIGQPPPAPDSTGQPPIPPDSIPPIEMQLNLDWTEAEFHRVNATEPVVVTLPGSMMCSHPMHWNLTAQGTGINQIPRLFFIEDVMGRPGTGNDIPMIFEIAINGGQFQPVEVRPDGSLLVQFMPGMNQFVLKMTALTEPFQSSGHYQLQMAQTVIPQL